MKVGIDPGLHGAIAIISNTDIIVHDMPIMDLPWNTTSKYRTMIDVNKVYEILEPHTEEITQINIEQVSPKSSQGISSTAVFMSAFYSVFNTVKLMGFEPVFLRPQKWKRKYGLINMPKDMSRVVCLKMYPFLANQLKRKKDVDRAEAILIGGY